MRVCYFGTYERSYPRNAQVVSCLRGAGVDVHEEHVSVWDEVRHGWSVGPGTAVRLVAAEARLFTRYLVGRPPPAELVDRYRAANAAIFTEPVAREDAALVAFARRHPWSVSLLDAASGLLRPGSLLRNKILLMAAILETSPAFADEFLPRDARPLRLLLTLLAHGTVAVARAALGAVVYAAAVRSRA